MGFLYHLLIVVLAVFGIVTGFRRGFFRQSGVVAGVLLGAVADRVFHTGVSTVVRGIFPSDDVYGTGAFFVSLMTSGVIFMLFYIPMMFLSGTAGRIFWIFGGGMLDSIAGAITGLFKYMLFLSFTYNLLLATAGSPQLLKYGTDDDGNLAEGVLLLAPAVFDCESFKDLARRIQLREAKKISYNNILRDSVKHREAEPSQITCCHA